jgi:ABC-type Fe3+-hydroxamate transport system substrate-binding protein/AraC-like DNA-binding protein
MNSTTANGPSSLVFALLHIRQLYGQEIHNSRYDSHTLIYINSGRGTINWNGHPPYAIRPGSCFLFSPGSTYTLYPEKDASPLQGYEITFDGIRILEAYHAKGQLRRVPAIFPFEGEINWYKQPQISEMLDRLYAQRGPADDRQEFQRQRLFLDLLDHVWEQAGGMETTPPIINPAIQRSILYMEQQYDQELTREQLALIADMSPGYYSSLFRKETGKSPMDMLAEIRIKHAKLMLVTSENPIRDIAQAVGFSNQYYFSTRFKQVVGLSPSAYVQRNHEQGIASSLLYTSYLCPSFSLIEYGAKKPQRLIGLFLEDYLTVLGIQPMVQYTRSGYSQRYLSGFLGGVQQLDVSQMDFGLLRSMRPDMILLGFPDFAADGRYEQFAEIAPTYVFQRAGVNWRSTLMSIASLVHREQEAIQAIKRYDEKTLQAKRELADLLGGETVALLRFHFREGLCLYGGSEGYTGSVLYEDLGLTMPPLLQEWSRTGSNSVIPIRPETLSQLDADHLLVIVDDAQIEQAQKLHQSDHWNVLRAVKHNQVYRGTTDIWMTFGLIAHEQKIKHLLESIRKLKKSTLE